MNSSEEFSNLLPEEDKKKLFINSMLEDDVPEDHIPNPASISRIPKPLPLSLKQQNQQLQSALVKAKLQVRTEKQIRCAEAIMTILNNHQCQLRILPNNQVQIFWVDPEDPNFGNNPEPNQG